MEQHNQLNGQRGHCHVEPLEKEVAEGDLRSATVSVLAVTGMGCPNCALRVHNALLSLPSVYEVEMDLREQRAVVRWNPELDRVESLLEAVAQAASGTRHAYRACLLA